MLMFSYERSGGQMQGTVEPAAEAQASQACSIRLRVGEAHERLLNN